jgi:hypothetical protein
MIIAIMVTVAVMLVASAVVATEDALAGKKNMDELEFFNMIKKLTT